MSDKGGPDGDFIGAVIADFAVALQAAEDRGRAAEEGVLTDNEGRARELAERIGFDIGLIYHDDSGHDQAKRFVASCVYPAVRAALKAERAAGLRQASEIVQDVPLNPVFDLSNGQVVRVCGLAANAIDAHIAALSSPRNSGENMSDRPEPASIWHHVKSGHDYLVIDCAVIKATLTDAGRVALKDTGR